MAMAIMFVSVYPVNYIKELNVIEAILSPKMKLLQRNASPKQSLTGDNRLEQKLVSSNLKRNYPLMVPEISKTTR